MLNTAADGSTSGSVTVSASRRFAIEGWAATSHGRVRTTVEERVDFVNRQTFTISAASYAQEIAQSTTFESRVRSEEHGRLSERPRQSSWPLAVKFVYATAADGSSTQVTTVRQQDESSHVRTINALPVEFALSSNVVSNADTLSFSAAGAFLGPSSQSSAQDYFAADLDGCYSRSLTSAAGLLTAVKDGALCW